MISTISFCLLFVLISFYGGKSEDDDQPVDYSKSTIQRSDVIFYFFPNGSSNIQYSAEDTKFDFDNKRYTLIIVHDYAESYKTSWVIKLINVFVRFKTPRNVIFVDWSKAAADWKTAPPNVKQLGIWVGELIRNGGLSPSKVSIIGLGLGAHAAGIAGKKLISDGGNNKNMLNRITGLDITGPKFLEDTPNENKLTGKDASFVDLIHTNAHAKGRKTPLEGGLDFYMSDGCTQPGCHNDTCSHQRAAVYYTNSITLPVPPLSKETNVTFDDQCKATFTDPPRPHILLFGFRTNPKATGVYRVRTTENSPYFS